MIINLHPNPAKAVRRTFYHLEYHVQTFQSQSYGYRGRQALRSETFRTREAPQGTRSVEKGTKPLGLAQNQA